MFGEPRVFHPWHTPGDLLSRTCSAEALSEELDLTLKSWVHVNCLRQELYKPFYVPIHLEYFPKIPKDIHIYIYIYTYIIYIYTYERLWRSVQTRSQINVNKLQSTPEHRRVPATSATSNKTCRWSESYLKIAQYLIDIYTFWISMLQKALRCVFRIVLNVASQFLTPVPARLCHALPRN